MTTAGNLIRLPFGSCLDCPYLSVQTADGRSYDDMNRVFCVILLPALPNEL